MWQESYDQARWVIDNASELNYSLEPDFQDLFRALKMDNSPEIIFAADFIGDQQESGYNNNNVNAFQSIEMEANSMRWDSWFTRMPGSIARDYIANKLICQNLPQASTL